MKTLPAKKRAKRAPPTFEVRFIGPGLQPEKVPLRAVNDALSAVQDIASGRDPFEEPRVPFSKGIGLVDVKRGSAVYSCVARAPEEALSNIIGIGEIVSAEGQKGELDNPDRVVAALRPLETLSKIAKAVQCRVEITVGKNKKDPLLTVTSEAYERISRGLLISGDATITGQVERVGGATEVRCLMRIPERRKLLYCDVENKELVRRLGQQLYQTVTAKGTAVWLHRTWRIYSFKISNFSQPQIGESRDTIKSLREAGLDAWDGVDDPGKTIRELRS